MTQKSTLNLNIQLTLNQTDLVAALKGLDVKPDNQKASANTGTATETKIADSASVTCPEEFLIL